MTVKSVIVPDGRRFSFGRKRPTVRYPLLQMKHYLPKLPSPPPVIDYSAAATVALGQMYENDQLGDCVIAAIAHTDGVLTGNAGLSGGLVLPTSEITSLYSTCCGYVPGDPSTDQGCDIQTVLNYWQGTGIADPSGASPHQIAGILTVDPANVNEIQTAIWLFENLIFGVDLPDAWITPFPSTSGFVWDVAGAADPANGHCFPALGYDSAKIMISTWGMIGFVTYAAVADYAAAASQGELYVVISQDSINKGTQQAPSGLNWSQLQADFAALGGSPTPTPPPPGPTPTPPPTPQPPVPVGPPDPNVLAAFLGNYEAYLSSIGASHK